jgi:hypothetical protein
LQLFAPTRQHSFKPKSFRNKNIFRQTVRHQSHATNFMKKFAILCIFFATSWTALAEQQLHDVSLKEIHRRTFPNGHIRYEYVFFANNDTRHRLNLIINVYLLDAAKKVLDQRFISFDTRSGLTETGKVESDYGPAVAGSRRIAASFYRLDIRNESHRRSYEKEGDLNVPLIQEKD